MKHLSYLFGADAPLSGDTRNGAVEDGDPFLKKKVRNGSSRIAPGPNDFTRNELARQGFLGGKVGDDARG